VPHRLWLRAFAEHIEIWTQSACVARHERKPGPGEPVTDFWHYLPLLLRKPGAFTPCGPQQTSAESRAIGTTTRRGLSL